MANIRLPMKPDGVKRPQHWLRAIQPFNLPPLKASAWQAGSSILQPFFIIHPSNNGLD
jgi:hypothetical protein